MYRSLALNNINKFDACVHLHPCALLKLFHHQEMLFKKPPVRKISKSEIYFLHSVCKPLTRGPALNQYRLGDVVDLILKIFLNALW